MFNCRLTRSLEIFALIVDDCPTDLKIIDELVQRLGFKTEAVESSAEAASLVERGEKYDVFFLDMIMPEMNGVELARKIRAISKYRDTPMVCISSMKGNFDKERALAAGMTDYLIKPVSKAEIKSVLDKYFKIAS